MKTTFKDSLFSAYVPPAYLLLSLPKFFYCPQPWPETLLSKKGIKHLL